MTQSARALTVKNRPRTLVFGMSKFARHLRRALIKGPIGPEVWHTAKPSGKARVWRDGEQMDDVDTVEFYSTIEAFAKTAKKRAGEYDFYCRIYEAPKYRERGKARYGAENDAMRFSKDDNISIVIDNLVEAVSSIVKEGGTFRIWIEALSDKTILHDDNFWAHHSKENVIAGETESSSPYAMEVALLREMNRDLRVERDKLMNQLTEVSSHVVDQSLKISKMNFEDRDNSLRLFGAMKALETVPDSTRDPVKDAMMLKIIERLDSVFSGVVTWAANNATSGKLPTANSQTGDDVKLCEILENIKSGKYSESEIKVMIPALKAFTVWAAKNEINVSD